MTTNWYGIDKTIISKSKETVMTMCASMIACTVHAKSK